MRQARPLSLLVLALVTGLLVPAAAAQSTPEVKPAAGKDKQVARLKETSAPRSERPEQLRQRE